MYQVGVDIGGTNIAMGLVDEALEYADGKLAGVCRYDGAPMLDNFCLWH